MFHSSGSRSPYLCRVEHGQVVGGRGFVDHGVAAAEDVGDPAGLAQILVNRVAHVIGRALDQRAGTVDVPEEAQPGVGAADVRQAHSGGVVDLAVAVAAGVLEQHVGGLPGVAIGAENVAHAQPLTSLHDSPQARQDDLGEEVRRIGGAGVVAEISASQADIGPVSAEAFDPGHLTIGVLIVPNPHKVGLEVEGLQPRRVVHAEADAACPACGCEVRAGQVEQAVPLARTRLRRWFGAFVFLHLAAKLFGQAIRAVLAEVVVYLVPVAGLGAVGEDRHTSSRSPKRNVCSSILLLDCRVSRQGMRTMS